MELISLISCLGFTYPESNRPESNRIEELPTLYAISKKGQLRTYKIHVEHHLRYSILVTSKQITENGKWQVDSYKFTEGVNIGKSNETTFSQQASLKASSMWRSLLDKGFTVSKPNTMYNTDANGCMKPMLASSFNEKNIKFPCLVQPKYDGVRCLLFEKDGEIQILSRKGKSYNIPHLQKWAEDHRSLLPLDGELYNHKELSFQEIISAVKKTSELTDKIRYVIYDRPISDVSNNDRWSWLLHNFKGQEKNSPLYLSSYTICHDMDSLWNYHDLCVKEGYEGAIIRNLDGVYEFGFRSKDLIKLKVFDDEEFEIVDVVEATGRDKGTAVFVCKCDSGEFNVKPQGTRELRRDYFNNRNKLIGKMVSVQYQGLSDDGIPRFPSAIVVRDYE